MQGRWREAYVKWRGLIAEQSGCGQSVAVFCRDRGLTTGQFFAWKQRLRRAAEEQFVEVQVERTAAQETRTIRGSAIEVHLAEGRRIFVEPGFDAEHLRAVVAALETRG
jgi:small ligand-binding sensory domain FIST